MMDMVVVMAVLLVDGEVTKVAMEMAMAMDQVLYCSIVFLAYH